MYLYQLEHVNHTNHSIPHQNDKCTWACPFHGLSPAQNSCLNCLPSCVKLHHATACFDAHAYSKETKFKNLLIVHPLLFLQQPFKDVWNGHFEIPIVCNEWTVVTNLYIGCCHDVVAHDEADFTTVHAARVVLMYLLTPRLTHILLVAWWTKYANMVSHHFLRIVIGNMQVTRCGSVVATGNAGVGSPHSSSTGSNNHFLAKLGSQI